VPPSRSDAPDVFSDRADAFLGALPTFQSQINSVSTYLDGLGTAVDADAAASALNAANAEAAADAALAASGATLWVSGTTYAAGDVVWSPITYQTFRRKTNGAGTTDPSLDSTNWQPLTTSGGALPSYLVRTGNYTAVNQDSILCVGTFTVTLPAAPTSGQFVVIGKDGGVITLGRNGSTINGAASDYTLNGLFSVVVVVYTGTTWQVVGDKAITATNTAVDNALVLFDGTTGKAVKSLASVGTAGQALLSNGAGSPPSFGSIPSQVELISTTNASAISLFDITGLSSSYSYYILVAQGIDSSALTDTRLAMRVSNDNGATWQTTANTYLTNDTVSTSGAGNTYFTVSGPLGLIAGAKSYMNLEIYGIGTAQPVFVHSEFACDRNDGTTSGPHRYEMAGSFRYVTGVNAIRFIVLGGTMNGTFKLYGVKA
jgi:hypothetical protein